MPQASTSHVTSWVQPKVKTTPFCPPPLRNIFEAYETANPDHVLRFGQWFFNVYCRGVLTEIKYPYNFDVLYNSTVFDEYYSIVVQMYHDYQWPLE